jgi:hypothetical protein
MSSRLSVTAAAVLVLAACSDGTGPATGSGVSLSFASDLTAVGVPAPGLFGGPMAGPITDGVNTLDLTSVQVVLREIELKRVEVTDCDVVPEPDGCESFETAPVLVDLPLDGSTSSDIPILIDPGTYDEVEFDIHEVTGNDDDAPFLLAHPELENKSITAEGTYNGVAFAFETNLSQEQKFDLVPNLVIGEDGAATNVTIRFDVSTWFVDGSGNLFNPATASTGQPNESMAEENIKNSIKAFEDRDKDGDDTDES